MLVLFCAHPLKPREVDPDYLTEFESAKHAGFDVCTINEQALIEGNVERSLYRIEPTSAKTLAFYRGWMMPTEIYRQLFDGLIDRGYVPINSPGAYQACHCLPDSYPSIQGNTPRSVWIANEDGLTDVQIKTALDHFGNKPIVIKDYVKSQKHHWNEACYIPDASDTDAAMRVINKLISLNDGQLQGGLVFREFVELEPLGTHSKSNMPITQEFRSIILDGQPIITMPYWDQGDYNVDFPPNELLINLARKIPSRLFTLDIARSKAGEWIIIELGDAQVAGLPDNCDVPVFYQKLMASLQTN